MPSPPADDAASYDDDDTDDDDDDDDEDDPDDGDDENDHVGCFTLKSYESLNSSMLEHFLGFLPNSAQTLQNNTQSVQFCSILFNSAQVCLILENICNSA